MEKSQKEEERKALSVYLGHRSSLSNKSNDSIGRIIHPYSLLQKGLSLLRLPFHSKCKSNGRYGRCYLQRITATI